MMMMEVGAAEPNAAAAADASDGPKQKQPSGGEVAVLISEPHQSPSAASHPNTSAPTDATEQMTGKDGTAEIIVSASEQEEEPPQILEEGPPPTVDELLVEYGSSLPPSPCTIPPSPGGDPEAAAPGNEPSTTETAMMMNGSGHSASSDQQLPQQNGEKEEPMAEDTDHDAQINSDSNGDGAEVESLEQIDRSAEQHIPNDDVSVMKSSVGSVKPLPQAQDEPSIAAERKVDGVSSGDAGAYVAASAGTDGAAEGTAEASESAGENNGDDTFPTSEPQTNDLIAKDKDVEEADGSAGDGGCDAPAINDDEGPLPTPVLEDETSRDEAAAEVADVDETNECDGENSGDGHSQSATIPAVVENGEHQVNAAAEVDGDADIVQGSIAGEDEEQAQEQEAAVPSPEAPALSNGNKSPPDERETDHDTRDEEKPKDEVPVEFTLTFTDYVDMQSRLVLVPLDDGECLGAKVASFGVTVEQQHQAEPGRSTGDNFDSTGEGNNQADLSETMEDIDLDTGSSEEKKGDDADEADLQSDTIHETPCSSASYSCPPVRPEDVTGSVLVKISDLGGDNGEEDDDDWTQVDFTYILSAMRDVKAPIILHFRRADDEGTASGNDTGTAPSASINVSESQAEATEQAEINSVAATADAGSMITSSSLMSTRLSRWGSRASQLAVEAKEKARIAMEEAERQLEKKGIADRIASVTSSKVGGSEGDGPNSTETVEDEDEDLTRSPRKWYEAGLAQPPCALYLQKASGSFAQLDVDPDTTDAPQVPHISESSLSNAVPLRPTLSSSSIASRASTGLSWRRKLARLHPVTNTSVLLIRAAAETPCPAKGYEFQWYRSCTRGADDTSSTSHASSRSPAASSEELEGWFALEGATYAAFQPSTTDIGHRIRCIVTIDPTQSTVGTPAVDTEGVTSNGPIQVICELPFPVVADPGLFSAARQGFAAPNGGIFGNLKGRGNASGRSFRLQIMPSEEGSRMRMFQTSGSTSELLHDVQEPIVFASATAIPAEPKVFDLYFPSGLPASAEMVRALCNEDGHFKLKAPNRIARESLLLSLGIANFCAFGGKPVDLDASTMLFPDTPHGAVIEHDRSRQCSRKEECNETIPHNVREVKVVSPVQEERVEDNGDPLPLPSLASNDNRPTASEEKTRGWMTPLLPLSPKTPGTDTTTEADPRFQVLEAELRSKIDTLFKKEKACTDLQRRVALAESGKKRSDHKVKSLQSESEMHRRKNVDCSRSLRSAEKKIEMNDMAMTRMRQEYEAKISFLEDQLEQGAKVSSEQEKTITTLTNEKAVLEAAVEARDGKLSAMETLQGAVSDLRKQVSDKESEKKDLDRCRADLEEMTARFSDAQIELEKTEHLKVQLQKSQESARKEQKAAERCKAQMESANMRCQKLKVELRSAKQKVESLSKDLSRAHATTRSANKDVAQANKMKLIQQECEELKKEISHLMSEKRCIAEERDESRRLHEQSIKSQVEAGIDGKVVQALERYDELERVVSELTEYVSAKEMQLDTMMEVNKALQEEITSLRKEK